MATKLTLKETINLTIDWYLSYLDKKYVKFTKSQIEFFLKK